MSYRNSSGCWFKAGGNPPAPCPLEAEAADICGANREKLQDEFSERARRLEAAAAKDPMVRYVDPFIAFCDDTLCRPNDGNRLFYSDDDHLNGGGTHRLIETFPEEFRWVFAR
ncbi:SGNH hydrolase domain-containing protein [Pseudohoeflea suaedae]|uniref:SGNH hydrolase domain-containing protein n=1 Tax=Pseudohoeflea suaedae TaxID=877384 RepID=UPI001FCF1438|nr:SGNH hydrolase domain-containing protein [Pseudohoeflea suaedae]